MAVLNITTYGAVGNNSTDCTAAIQSCFNAAKAGGHSVLIPSGSFRYSNVIKMDSIKVTGTGDASKLIATGTDKTAIWLAGNGPELSNIFMTALNAVQATYGPCTESGGNRLSNRDSTLILIDGATNFRVTRVHINKSMRTGIFVYSSSTAHQSFGYIGYNTVENTNADSIHLTSNAQTHDILVEWNRVVNSGDDGTAFVSYNRTTTGTPVWNCTSQYNTVLFNKHGRGITAIGSKNCKIQFNHIEGGIGEKAGIMLAQEAGNYGTYPNTGMLCKGNTIKFAGGQCSGHGAIHQYDAFSSGPQHENVTIENNQVFKAKKNGLVINGSRGGNNITVRNNTFYACVAAPLNILSTPSNFVNTGNSGNLAESAYPGDAIPAGDGHLEGEVTPALPTISLPTSLSVAEGQAISITVQKSGTGACSVTWQTTARTATSADFTPVGPTTLSFASADTSKTITVQTTADQLVEADETFDIVLSSPTGCTLGNTTTTVTVLSPAAPVDPVALPYLPIPDPDIFVNLNTTSARSFVGSVYAGKHVRVVSKTTVDTSAGLYFEDCASVTIIGGSFKPASRALNGSIDSGASLYFKGCGEIYIEGVIVDNASITQGHAVLVHAGLAETDVTIQNCRLVNVTGLETGIKGNAFHTGGANEGRTGTVRMHNVTISTNASTRAIYIPPETGGGWDNVSLRNVNFFRVGGLGGFGFFHFLNNATQYSTNMGPISLVNVFAAMGAGQTVEVQGIWPNATAAAVVDFGGPKFAAVRRADPLNNRVGAYWPQLLDAGREVEGYIYEGTPTAGDFVPVNRVGLSYIPGVDIVEPDEVVGIPDPEPDPLPPTTNVINLPNLFAPTGWTLSAGATIDSGTGAITLVSTGTKVFARYVAETFVGKKYVLTYNVPTSQPVFRAIGTAAGAANILASAQSPTSGDERIEFTATGTQTHIEFSRTTTGTALAGSILVTDLAENRTSGRRLNGISQTFKLDIAAAGMPTNNFNWYLGGWIRFTYLPTSAVYIAEFGRPDPASSNPGAGRVRLVYDVLNKRLLASTAQNDGNNYRECRIETDLRDNVWYHVAMMVDDLGDVRLVINGISASVYVGVSPDPATDVCRVITLGARGGSPATFQAPISYSDWIYCSGFVPTGSQIATLAAGSRPNAVQNLQPTCHWAMTETATTEPSISPNDSGQTGLTTSLPLIANGSPVPVVGLAFAGAAPSPSTPPMDIIII